jgi:soluble lytic murein transglycosylase-like protein
MGKDFAKISMAVLLIYFCKFLLIVEEPVEKKATAYESASFDFINEKTPPCIQMQHYIRKYAKEYNVPLNYAFGVASCETSYDGPLDWSYNPAQTSCAGAVGPMQVMPATASFVWKEKVSADKLKNDIRFNVETSMKYVAYLYNRYRDWPTVFGCYNTGRPMINEYARKVVNFVPKKVNL